jgi:carbamoyl-phosphate synthase large subunit
LKKYDVEMIGAKPAANPRVRTANSSSSAMLKIGLDVAVAHGEVDGRGAAAAEMLGDVSAHHPAVVHARRFSGGGIAYNKEEFERICANGLDLSPVHEVLVEECLLGWKEYEMEVMRDHKDQCVVICSIENFDPMGVHTGDSITVAPAQTLSDREYQLMRDASFAVIREIGVETGGSATCSSRRPRDGRMVVIEMNPRVSRSSALASKATGFPIAKIAAKLAVGYTLDELRNDITRRPRPASSRRSTTASSRSRAWAFEKFPTADSVLTTQMKSVGEVMAIGRTFKEAMQKALRSLEIGARGFGNAPGKPAASPRTSTPKAIRPQAGDAARRPHRHPHRMLPRRHDVEEVSTTHEDRPVVPRPAEELVEHGGDPAAAAANGSTDRTTCCARPSSARLQRPPDRRRLPRQGHRMAGARAPQALGVTPVYKRVDTCAAEYPSVHAVPLLDLRRHRGRGRCRPTAGKQRVIVLGGGPNRIGQGIEFDYCCVHAAMALREARLRDGDGQQQPGDRVDRLRHLRHAVLRAADARGRDERRRPHQPHGVIVQFGGQTPLNLARGLQDHGAPLVGTSVDSIDEAEDRELFSKLITKLGIDQPPNGMAATPSEALAAADRIGYPVLVRPSFVLGGRAMEVVYDRRASSPTWSGTVRSPRNGRCWSTSSSRTRSRSTSTRSPTARRRHRRHHGAHRGGRHPLRRLELLAAAVHAGRRPDRRDRREDRRLARALKVIGLMNVQWAVRGNKVYILEANPRASRTVPFVSKAIGVPLAKLAAALVREGSRLPVRAVPWRDHRARTRNAVDRRSHGPRRRSGRGLRQGAGCGQARPAGEAATCSSP